MYNPDGLAMHYAYSKIAINQAIIRLGVETETVQK